MIYLNLRTFFNPKNWPPDKKQLFPCLAFPMSKRCHWKVSSLHDAQNAASRLITMFCL